MVMDQTSVEKKYMLVPHLLKIYFGQQLSKDNFKKI